MQQAVGNDPTTASDGPAVEETTVHPEKTPSPDARQAGGLASRGVAPELPPAPAAAAALPGEVHAYGVALQEALEREGAGRARAALAERGAEIGSARMIALAKAFEAHLIGIAPIAAVDPPALQAAAALHDYVSRASMEMLAQAQDLAHRFHQRCEAAAFVDVDHARLQHRCLRVHRVALDEGAVGVGGAHGKAIHG